MDTTKVAARDWSATLFLPKTDFPMKAGLPQLEPKLLERWERLGLYARLRAAAKGKPKFILHDGPPYANANIHIGTALNKILKDMVTRSQQMLGFDSNYVPGWDCHGLPIEWKIEEQYRARGQDKDHIPLSEFRRQCRDFAQHWIGVQCAEFKRLGVEGDWDHYYSTMSFRAEAIIASELMKFALNGALYRGSKPVMWSVVEKTALAEAEVEYHDISSDSVWVRFPLLGRDREGNGTITPLGAELTGASVLIWTTTPWTLPGNRAISFSPKIRYIVLEVTAAAEGSSARPGERLILAEKLAPAIKEAARIDAWAQVGGTLTCDGWVCAHPLAGIGYTFPVPLLPAEHVTETEGTGFVHTAPGHGREDFEVWSANAPLLKRRGIATAIPFTVAGDGRLTEEAPGFTDRRVLDEDGNRGDANAAIIEALRAAHALLARGRLKHQYPHSWRSKKPVIFRNTLQWFIAMDRPIAVPVLSPGGPANARAHERARFDAPQSLRARALEAIAATQFVPVSGRNRLRGMVESKPDWVISRQRAWGVPITVFVHGQTGAVIPAAAFPHSGELIARIRAAMMEKGADAWFEPGAKERFLAGLVPRPADWEQVSDILDVWFDSGSTHAFTLEDASAFPSLAGIVRQRDGGRDRVMYLEGSDQHRGWFQASLLESCGTRGRAPFDIVLTHGFILDEKGEEKMSKSKGNTLSPQDLMQTTGADILRLWVGASDYSGDIRFGPGIVQGAAEAYRKLRNTLRWMLGTLAHYDAGNSVPVKVMPELERFMLHRLSELDALTRKAYAEYDFKRVVAALSHFMSTELSAFYFDIRRDALYCEPASSLKRKAALETIEQLFRCVTLWLAPLLPFTMEEAWLARYPSAHGSVHLELFPRVPGSWCDDALAHEWAQIKRVRRVVTGALEIERARKNIGSSLEAAPQVYIDDEELMAAVEDVDFAEVCITSDIEVIAAVPPPGAFVLPEVPGVGVVVRRAEGQKCARSRRITKDVGADPDYPELSARDAVAVREFDARRQGA